jgi:CheY-like chemotaxis protein
MIRVLVVDDEEEWRTLITHALPDYRVDTAASYPEALDLLRDGTPYDAAVVDLNLVRRAAVDWLGGTFLGHLRDNHPATPRIALTGTPPGAVGGLIAEYGLTELLLKASMTLAELREAVEKGLRTSDVPSELRAERGDRWDEFRQWRDSIRRHIDREAGKLEAERRHAARDSVPRREAADALAALKVGKAAFESDCSGVATMLANIRDPADLDAAAREFATLEDKYEDVF